MRASFWVLGPLLARCGEARVSHARRLRHRHAPGRPAPDGPQGAGRRDRHRRRLRGRQGAARACSGARIIFPKVSVGATHNVLMAAALAKGETRDRERRARARDRRRRRMPRQDGRQDRGHRHLDAAHPGPRPARGRRAHRAARPHRDRHLCLRRGGGRRRRGAQGRAQEPAARPRSTRWSRPASPSPRRPTGVRVARNGGDARARSRSRRSRSRASRPTCRRS